jgi:lipoprotein-anchoring transpeptidase ErfK/SrfK
MSNALKIAFFLAVTVFAASAQTQPSPSVKRTLIVSLPDRRLALTEDGVVKKIYTVAVGKTETPSPAGTFTIVNRVANPSYTHNGKVIPAGPANPVGTRWIGLSVKGYGIHGTSAPRSIGKAASHGCIRMARRDLEELYAQVRTGDMVEILAERNTETARLFDVPADTETESGVEVAAAPETVPATRTEPAALPVGQ